MRAALGASVEVRDAEGVVVGRSTVGGQPIGMPAGTDDLVVLDEPSVACALVYVALGADVVVTAPGG